MNRGGRREVGSVEKPPWSLRMERALERSRSGMEEEPADQQGLANDCHERAPMG